MDVRFETWGYHWGDILGYPPILAGDIRSRDGFRPIARDLMDHKERFRCLTNAENYL